MDDYDLIQSGAKPLNALESMHEFINSLGLLTGVTIRVLNPDTSWWYFVDYVWHRGTLIAHDADG